MNLAANLVDAVRNYGDRPAVRSGDEVWTYTDLNEQSARVAGFLRAREIQPGDRVALQLPNLMQFPAIYYGILRVGAIVVPMNPLLKEREVDYYMSDSGARLLFDMPSVGLPFDTRADYELTERSADDTAVILYTSGTTGRPKGAELTHFNLKKNAEVNVTTLLNLTHEDVVMGCLPLFHSFGQTAAMNSAFSVGASLSLVPKFEAQLVLEVIEHDKVTVFMGVPTMYSGLLNSPAREKSDLSSLRVCVSGGAPLPVELLHGFEAATGAMILEGYGLSETSPIASFNHPDRPRKAGSIGTPLSGVEMKLVSVSEGVGEIAIKGHNIMKGYWGNPAATEEAIKDGWFHTGDLATQDEDGYFFIVDRKKDLIIRGGLNVYPREVEEVLYEHPAVAEAAVIGLPHSELGEDVAAAVALKPGMSVLPEELSAFVKERIAAYKYPRKVWLVDELPKTATGKILRREVHPPAE
jgi:long-chain acyl-CoA synthetase